MESIHGSRALHRWGNESWALRASQLAPAKDNGHLLILPWAKRCTRAMPGQGGMLMSTLHATPIASARARTAFQLACYYDHDEQALLKFLYNFSSTVQCVQNQQLLDWTIPHFLARLIACFACLQSGFRSRCIPKGWTISHAHCVLTLHLLLIAIL